MIILSKQPWLAVAALVVTVGISCQAPVQKRRLNTSQTSEHNNEPTAEITTAPPEMERSEINNNNQEQPLPLEDQAVVHAIVALPVPFTPQAPQANWEMPYQEACEEASMVMVVEYFNGNHQSNLETDYADKEILDLIAWEEANGYAVDLTAWQVAEVLQKRYKLKAEAVPYDANLIRDSIKNGKLVILPAAGRLLGNPYFRQPGPLYHMLVVKGFEGNEFITNDPGTKRGLSYRYTEEALAYAVHDWNGGEVEAGKQVMIVVSDGLE